MPTRRATPVVRWRQRQRRHGEGVLAATCSGARLVASTVSPRAAASSSATDGAAASTCSKLSSTSRRCLSARKRGQARAQRDAGALRDLQHLRDRARRPAPGRGSGRAGRTTRRRRTPRAAPQPLPTPGASCPPRPGRSASRRRDRRAAAAHTPRRARGHGRASGVRGSGKAPRAGGTFSVGATRRSGLSSARAAWANARRRSLGSSRHCISRSARWGDGRRSSASILRIVTVEQPARRASSAWLSSSTIRRSFSHFPNEAISSTTSSVGSHGWHRHRRVPNSAVALAQPCRARVSKAIHARYRNRYP